MEKNTIAVLIKNVADNRLASKYNLSQYKEGAKLHKEKECAILHKKVCEEVVAFAESHKDIPLYFILSVGVSKGAYKVSEFNKGYKAFKADEVEMVAKMGRAYLDYNSQYGKKMSDVTIRLIMRYYEKVSHDYNKFLLDLNNSKVLGRKCGKRDVPYEKLCANLNIPITERVLEDVA